MSEWLSEGKNLRSIFLSLPFKSWFTLCVFHKLVLSSIRQATFLFSISLGFRVSSKGSEVKGNQGVFHIAIDLPSPTLHLARLVGKAWLAIILFHA